MPGELPTADEFFGAPHAPAPGVAPPPAPVTPHVAGQLPTADEFFGAPTIQDSWSRQMDQSIQRGTYKVLDAFGYGAREGFGHEPIATPATSISPETQDALRKMGLWNDYVKGQADYTKSVIEEVMRGGAAAAALTSRLATGALSAPLEAGGQLLENLGVKNATGEAGLRGMATDPGVMMLFGPEMGGFAGLANATRAKNLAPLETDLARARASGVIGEGEAGFHDAVPLTPENKAAREIAAQDAGVAPDIEPPAAPPKDVHELARRLEPEAFAEFDAKAAEIEQLQAVVHDLPPEAEGTPAAIEATQRLTDAQTDLAATIPDVEDAYRQAHEIMPEKAVDVAAPLSETPTEAGGTPKPQRTTTALRPVQGTGETKVRGLAEHVEAKAIENTLADNFGDLPEYQQLSMADQAERAQALIVEDYESAKAVAMGQKTPPRGVLPESVYVAVEKAATAEGDVDLLRQLATESKLTTAATTMGQRIRTLGERDKASPVAAIQEVQAAREAAIAQRADLAAAKRATAKEIKTAMRSGASTKQDWSSFIQSITCAD